MTSDRTPPSSLTLSEAKSSRLLDRLDTAPLHAWGAVRNDVIGRDPETRATMIRKQGIKRVAIDWRYVHLETLDRELAALRAREIAAIALWAPISLVPLNDAHLDLLFGFIEHNRLQITLWTTLMHPHDIDEWVESKKLDLTSEAVGRLADRAARLGCSVALYNYDGWFARPPSLRKIVAAANRPNVGIVYNFHHAHADVAEFGSHIAAMLPMLAAVNLGGITAGPPLPFGKGKHDFSMLAALLDAGYGGPLGITCYDAQADAVDTLSQSLAGLAAFRRALERREGRS